MKWTTRKGGQVMGTFQVRVHVPKDMVEFIQEQCGWSQKAAVEWIQQNWHHMHETFDVLMVGPAGEPEIIGENNVDTVGYDGYVAYEGGGIVVTR